MTDAEDLDDQHILFNARELKDGIWLERIPSQIRRSMCGMGVDTFKDLPDKVAQGLPNLTRPASHPTWEQYVFKMACLVKDGAQLVHCTHAILVNSIAIYVTSTARCSSTELTDTR